METLVTSSEPSGQDSVDNVSTSLQPELSISPSHTHSISPTRSDQQSPAHLSSTASPDRNSPALDQSINSQSPHSHQNTPPANVDTFPLSFALSSIPLPGRPLLLNVRRSEPGKRFLRWVNGTDFNPNRKLDVSFTDDNGVSEGKYIRHDYKSYY